MLEDVSLPEILLSRVQSGGTHGQRIVCSAFDGWVIRYDHALPSGHHACRSELKLCGAVH